MVQPQSVSNLSIFSREFVWAGHEPRKLAELGISVEGKKRDAARFLVIICWLSVNWETAKLARI